CPFPKSVVTNELVGRKLHCNQHSTMLLGKQTPDLEKALSTRIPFLFGFLKIFFFCSLGAVSQGEEEPFLMFLCSSMTK
ncbi:hypothetical protein DKP78_20560, partial [Enterococcus faecium]